MYIKSINMHKWTKKKNDRMIHVHVGLETCKIVCISSIILIRNRVSNLFFSMLNNHLKNIY